MLLPTPWLISQNRQNWAFLWPYMLIPQESSFSLNRSTVWPELQKKKKKKKKKSKTLYFDIYHYCYVSWHFSVSFVSYRFCFCLVRTIWLFTRKIWDMDYENIADISAWYKLNSSMLLMIFLPFFFFFFFFFFSLLLLLLLLFFFFLLVYGHGQCCRRRQQATLSCTPIVSTHETHHCILRMSLNGSVPKLPISRIENWQETVSIFLLTWCI